MMNPRPFSNLVTLAGTILILVAACSRDSNPPPARESAASPSTPPVATESARVTPDTATKPLPESTSPRLESTAKRPKAKPAPAKQAALVSAPATPSAAATATPQDQWLKYDAATNTVTFELIGGPFTFNGHRNGEATLTLPPKTNVVMNFVNKDGTPHSAIVISGDGPIPNSASDPAIPRAYTNKVLEGLPQEGSDVMRFPAPETGKYRIFCGVPGHGLSGMWLWMTVDPAAKIPSFGPTK